jgi:hypothetical protein
MRMSIPDRNEFLKAAIKTTDRAVADWLVAVVDVIDGLPEGKNDIPCPPYVPPARPQGNGQQLLSSHPYA